jgi:bifunctional non-homologous end joining protein LigD
MFAHAANLDCEGIVSKNPAAPYRSDRNEGWLKIPAIAYLTIPGRLSIARQISL